MISLINDLEIVFVLIFLYCYNHLNTQNAVIKILLPYIRKFFKKKKQSWKKQILQQTKTSQKLC
jgi:hypothetical protein